MTNRKNNELLKRKNRNSLIKISIFFASILVVNHLNLIKYTIIGIKNPVRDKSQSNPYLFYLFLKQNLFF